MQVIPLYDAKAEAELERLWQDFLAKRAVSLAGPTMANTIAAGKAYGRLLAALAVARETTLVAFQQRTKVGG